MKKSNMSGETYFLVIFNVSAISYKKNQLHTIKIDKMVAIFVNLVPKVTYKLYNWIAVLHMIYREKYGIKVCFF